MVSLKEERIRKLEEYGQNIPGIKAFFNFWVPAITIISVWGVWSEVISWSNNPIGFIMTLIISVLGLSCFLFGFFWDRDCFISSVVFLIVLGVVRIVDFVQVIISTANVSKDLSQAVSTTADNLGYAGETAGSIVSTGINFGTQIVLLGEIIGLLLFAIFVISYLAIFIKNRDFFIK